MSPARPWWSTAASREASSSRHGSPPLTPPAGSSRRRVAGRGAGRPGHARQQPVSGGSGRGPSAPAASCRCRGQGQQRTAVTSTTSTSCSGTASLLESGVPAVRPEGSDLIARTQIVEPGISDKERFQLDLATMKVSQEVASVVALRQLGYHVPIRPDGVRVVAVTSGSHAAGLVRPGDVIVAADGKPVRTRTDLRRPSRGTSRDDVVNLVIRRGGRSRRCRRPDDVRPPGPEARRSSASSDSGAPCSAAVPDQVQPAQGRRALGRAGVRSRVAREEGRDVDHGYKVAATGEIQLDGSVTRIGGIKQKTIGARKSHVRRLPRPGRWGQRQGREALRAWPEDHPCEEFSTGVARAGNTAAKEVRPV